MFSASVFYKGGYFFNTRNLNLSHKEEIVPEHSPRHLKKIIPYSSVLKFDVITNLAPLDFRFLLSCFLRESLSKFLYFCEREMASLGRGIKK